MQSLGAYLEGDFNACRRAIEGIQLEARTDPEVLFYAARQLAQIQEHKLALDVLFNAIDSGFLCGSALSRDPWLASLHSSPDHSRLLQAANQRRSQAHTRFVEAGGPHLLNFS